MHQIRGETQSVLISFIQCAAKLCVQRWSSLSSLHQRSLPHFAVTTYPSPMGDTLIPTCFQLFRFLPPKAVDSITVAVYFYSHRHLYMAKQNRQALNPKP